jgi:hypothetical protein
MRTGHLHIEHRPAGEGKTLPVSKVTLDDQDISHLITSATVTFAPGSMPTAELGVVAYESGWAGEAELILTPGTAELLERFGWTPPNGE